MHVFASAELVDQRQADTTIMLQMFWLQANHSYGRRRSIPPAWTEYSGTSVPTQLLVLGDHKWRIERSPGLTLQAATSSTFIRASGFTITRKFRVAIRANTDHKYRRP